MEAISVIVAFIGWKTSGYDFPTLYFYISLALIFYKAWVDYTDDKTTKGRQDTPD